MLNIMVLDNARVNKFFKNNHTFVEDLSDEIKTYRQENGEIAIVMDLIQKEISEQTLQDIQVICESMYFKYDETHVNFYLITLGCTLLVKEHEMHSIASFSIKICCRDYSYL